MKACQACGKPLTGKQVNTCSGACRVALHRAKAKGESVTPSVTSVTKSVTPVTDNSVLLPALERIIAELKAMNSKLDRGIAMPQATAPRAFSPSATAPDLEIEVNHNATSDEIPTFNLMISMTALSSNWAALPREVLEYGVKMKRVPPHVLEGSQPVSAGNPKAMAGAELVFAPPEDFDDISWT
jgi:hypothetical protein